MSQISSMEDLAITIDYLEREQFSKRKELQEEITLFYDTLTPASLIKKSLTNLFSSGGLMDVLAGALSGVASGYISKKLISGSSLNPIRRAAGSILEVAVTAFFVRHGDKIRILANYLFKRPTSRGKLD